MSMTYLTGKTPLQGRVTPLIDGKDYFKDFFDNLETLQPGDKLYLLNWHINNLFFRKSSPDDIWKDKTKDDFLLTKLQGLVQNGVEVKILIWVNTNMFIPFYPMFKIQERDVPEGALKAMWNKGLEQARFSSILEKNLKTVHEWRNLEYSDIQNEEIIINTNTSLKDNIIINTLDALGGGIHSKFAIFLHKTTTGYFQAQSYTGGMDLAPNRYAMHKHLNNPNDPEWINYWHDVMVKVEGDANIDLLKFYQDLWNENIDRKANYNPEIEIRISSIPISIRCIPDGAVKIEDTEIELNDVHNHHMVQSLRTLPNIFPIFGEPELSFAEDGIFEIRDSIHHALQQAQKYIYIEDQLMNSLELFADIKNALQTNSELKVILLSLSDPSDPETTIDKILLNYFHYSELNTEQKARLYFYQASYTIHSKVFLIDDEIAIVGSAGFITRSMTQELEHSISFIDNSGVNSIKNFREKLWAEHLVENVENHYPTIEQALEIWNTDLSNKGLTKINLDEYKFIDISPFWLEIPSLILKESSDITLSTQERNKLDLLKTYKEQLQEAAMHMITLEIPFSSWFNPSTDSPIMGIQFIQNEQVAINEIAKLELISSHVSVVSWKYTDENANTLTGVGEEFEIQFSSPGLKTVLAVQSFGNTNKVIRYPFSISVMENSGPHWHEKFPTSKKVEDLDETFKTRVEEFIFAIENNTGLTVQIFATYRPPERAYLMAYAYKIANGLNPKKIKERLENVPISWEHYDSNGNIDLNLSKQAAQAMVQSYNIGSSGAVFPSKHSEGTAIDMKIQLNQPVQIKNKHGQLVWVKNQEQLKNIALTYGIKRYKLTNHWSLSGH